MLGTPHGSCRLRDADEFDVLQKEGCLINSDLVRELRHPFWDYFILHAVCSYRQAARAAVPCLHVGC